MIAQPVDRHVFEAVDAALRVFLRRTGVDEGDASVAREGRDLVPVELPHPAGKEIFDHEARDVDGVLRGGEGRSVAELELRQVGGGHARADSGRQHVAALVDAVEAHELGAEDLPRPRSKTTFISKFRAPG